MKRQGSLQWFLIKKFIEILLVVGIVEYVITFFMNRLVLPLMLTYFFPEYEKNLTVASSEITVFIFAGLFILLLSSFGALFPTPVREAITELLQRTQHGLSYLSQSAEKEVPILGLGERKSMLLFCVLFAMALVVLLPYALGALRFASITIREFREIQKEREAEQNEFNRKRNLMLSDIAHDLRTPMTTVNGYAKALADGMVTDSQKQQEYLEAIQKKSVRMNELINLLFEYVKLDSEGFSLDRKEVNLCELLRENAALVYADIEDVGMEFDIEIPEEVIMVSADAVQVSRVVTNLLTNAMRHNPPGTRIGLYLHKSDEHMYVMVADSGPFVPAELEAHLFEPFAKGDASRKSGGGSGLGLSIAKRVVEMHGWKMLFLQQPQIQHYPCVERYAKAFIIEIM